MKAYLRHFYQYEIAIVLYCFDEGVFRLAARKHAPRLRGPRDGVGTPIDLQRTRQVHEWRETLRLRPVVVQAKRLDVAEGEKRQRREYQARDDAEGGETQPRQPVAVPQNAHQGDEAENDGGDGADECESADHGAHDAGQGEQTGAQRRSLSTRCLDRLLTFRAGHHLAGESVFHLEPSAAIARQRQSHERLPFRSGAFVSLFYEFQRTIDKRCFIMVTCAIQNRRLWRAEGESPSGNEAEDGAVKPVSIMPSSIFFKVELPSATTWFYFSGLLAVALFFKFTRLLSVRNLDVLTVFLLMPGLLLLLASEGRDWWGYVWLFCASGYFLRALSVRFDLGAPTGVESQPESGGPALAGSNPLCQPDYGAGLAAARRHAAHRTASKPHQFRTQRDRKTPRRPCGGTAVACLGRTRPGNAVPPLHRRRHGVDRLASLRRRTRRHRGGDLLSALALHLPADAGDGAGRRTLGTRLANGADDLVGVLLPPADSGRLFPGRGGRQRAVSGADVAGVVEFLLAARRAAF